MCYWHHINRFEASHLSVAALTSNAPANIKEGFEKARSNPSHKPRAQTT